MFSTAKTVIDVPATCWHHASGRQEIHLKMKELENAFKYCDRDKYPGRWFRLQEELGDIYERIMKYYR